MIKPARIIFISVLTLVLAVLFVLPSARPLTAPARAEPSKEIVLDTDTFNGDLNEALFTSPEGLQGQPGTVKVPKGRWQQTQPVIMRSGQRIIGEGVESVIV